MQPIRTDLALEAKGSFASIPGIRTEQKEVCGHTVTRVCVTTREAAKRLGKPIGSYVTVEKIDLTDRAALEDGELAVCIGEIISSMLPGKERGTVLVAGLGNRTLTPDSLGPRAADGILVSRHILTQLGTPGVQGLRPVCVLNPGVMSTTGMETGEILGAVIRRIRPSAVIAVDALAARSTSRILSAVQISDAGVAPGSGVGNHRTALTEETLGVPVIAVGVPMVVHAATILRDAAENMKNSEIDIAEVLRELSGENLVVTPVIIDEAVRNAAALLSEAINLALQPGLTREEIRALCI